MAPKKERPKSPSSIRKLANERKFECGKCKSVVENVICCERCVQWLCMACADIKTEAKFKFLQEDDITWFCTACRGLAVQAAQTDKLIEDRCKHYMAIALAEIKSVKQELKDDIGTVDTRVSKLLDEVNVLKNEIVNIREEQGTGSKNEVEKLKEQITKMYADRVKDKEEATREMTQREIRRVNIVAFNVPEGNSEDIENRRQHDRESFKQICDDLKIDNIEVISVTRLQSKNALPEGEIHPKPLRIRLKTEEMRSDVIRKARMLAKSESATHRKIYLKRDMTPLERAEVAKSRRNTLHREEAGGNRDQLPAAPNNA